MRSSDQQWLDLIQKSNSILLFLQNPSSIDAVAAAGALMTLLERKGKSCKLITTNPINEQFHFLPYTSTAKQNIQVRRDYVCTIQTPGTTIDDVQYEKLGSMLRIFLTPHEGEILQEQISISKGAFKNDLIITLNCQDLEQLDTLYKEHSELFFETPILNIDHNPSNEYFGTTNIVDITATSTSEIIYNLLLQYYEEEINEALATTLLAGIIGSTESFQSSNTTPRALIIAADLIERGGNQPSIIQHLYKTRDLATLKLWGRVMARIEYNPDIKTTWSLVTQNDFAKTGTSLSAIPSMLKELQTQTQQSNITLILFENETKEIQGVAQLATTTNAPTILSALQGKQLQNYIEFTVQTNDILAAEKEILQKIKEVSNRQAPHSSPIKKAEINP